MKADQMPAIDEHTARGLSYRDLLEQLAVSGAGSYPHHVFAAELRRREGRTARLALGISFLSLLVSFVALLARA